MLLVVSVAAGGSQRTPSESSRARYVAIADIFLQVFAGQAEWGRVSPHLISPYITHQSLATEGQNLRRRPKKETKSLQVLES